MARIKRFHSAVWGKNRDGEWIRYGVSKPMLTRPPSQAAIDGWTHRHDKLEAIIGDKLNKKGEREHRLRFTPSERKVYHETKVDFAAVESQIDDESADNLNIYPTKSEYGVNDTFHNYSKLESVACLLPEHDFDPTTYDEHDAEQVNIKSDERVGDTQMSDADDQRVDVDNEGYESYHEDEQSDANDPSYGWVVPPSYAGNALIRSDPAYGRWVLRKPQPKDDDDISMADTEATTDKESSIGSAMEQDSLDYGPPTDWNGILEQQTTGEVREDEEEDEGNTDHESLPTSGTWVATSSDCIDTSENHATSSKVRNRTWSATSTPWYDGLVTHTSAASRGTWTAGSTSWHQLSDARHSPYANSFGESLSTESLEDQYLWDVAVSTFSPSTRDSAFEPSSDMTVHERESVSVTMDASKVVRTRENAEGLISGSKMEDDFSEVVVL